MRQRDVDKLVYANAAAWVRDAEFNELFGDDFMDSDVTDEQMERAQRSVADQLQKKAAP
jgi:hypothetical protein